MTPEKRPLCRQLDPFQGSEKERRADRERKNGRKSKVLSNQSRFLVLSRGLGENATISGCQNPGCNPPFLLVSPFCAVFYSLSLSFCSTLFKGCGCKRNSLEKMVRATFSFSITELSLGRKTLRSKVNF